MVTHGVDDRAVRNGDRRRAAPALKLWPRASGASRRPWTACARRTTSCGCRSACSARRPDAAARDSRASSAAPTRGFVRAGRVSLAARAWQAGTTTQDVRAHDALATSMSASRPSSAVLLMRSASVCRNTSRSLPPPPTVLDVGCVRREFLALLREQGIAARGIDTTRRWFRCARVRGCRPTLVMRCPSCGAAGGCSRRPLAAQVVEHLEPSVPRRLPRRGIRRAAPRRAIVLETINAASWFAFFGATSATSRTSAAHPDT